MNKQSVKMRKRIAKELPVLGSNWSVIRHFKKEILNGRSDLRCKLFKKHMKLKEGDTGHKWWKLGLLRMDRVLFVIQNEIVMSSGVVKKRSFGMGPTDRFTMEYRGVKELTCHIEI